MEPFLERLRDSPGVVSVCVLGSAARTGVRPTMDDFSDFDIAVFFDGGRECICCHSEEDCSTRREATCQNCLPPDWLPNYKFVRPESCSGNKSGFDVNVHQLCINREEASTSWPTDRLEAFAETSEFYYDPDGRVQKIVKRMLEESRRNRPDRIAALLTQLRVRTEHTARKALDRGFVIASRIGICNATLDCVRLLFELNDKLPCNEKWIETLSVNLPLQPKPGIKKVFESVDHALTNVDGIHDAISKIDEFVLSSSRFAQERFLVPVDYYGYTVSRLRTGWQAQDKTSADKLVEEIDKTDQYEKMENSNWNKVNFLMVDS